MSAQSTFGYPLHADQCFTDYRGASIELAGVPTIPRALMDFWARNGHDVDPPASIAPLIRESIEAACYVIQHRHAAAGHANRVDANTNRVASRKRRVLTPGIKLVRNSDFFTDEQEDDAL